MGNKDKNSKGTAKKMASSDLKQKRQAKKEKRDANVKAAKKAD